MILESAQLLSSAHRLLDGQMYIEQKYVNGSLPARFKNVKRWRLNDEREKVLYGVTHINHPSAIWCRSNIDHYRYLYDLFCHLMDEYTYRYGKVHKCDSMRSPLFNCPLNIDYEAPWQDPPQAMPDDSKVAGNSAEAYRNYYINHKARFAKWTKRQEPNWWKKD